MAIESYKVYWRPELHYGVLTIVDSGQSYQLTVDNPQEMMLMVDILRNEKPVSFFSRTKAISTGPEPVGEAE